MINLVMVVVTTIVTSWGFYYARKAYLTAERQEQYRDPSSVAIWTVPKGSALNPYDGDAIQIQNMSTAVADSVYLLNWTNQRQLKWVVKDGRATVDSYGGWDLADIGPCTSVMMQHPDPENDAIGLLFVQQGRTWLVVVGQPPQPLGDRGYVVNNKMTSVSFPVTITFWNGSGVAPTPSPTPPIEGHWRDSAC
ncbi:hypothetical protein [Plantactinospora sp. BB1]|uniref:hypothetical protein n=1 Tax=Plantactinospora sp. BB1 TaxID=2071627 RepID=UPI000D171898|nr:hypothetical protein [Plantactinospora sp. BB1]AVT40736.1 hypothetical protein C6W10_34630 [Plantactinospora sp. BB1]